MTHFERIKTMNIEEMAVMLADEIPHGDCYGCDKCDGCTKHSKSYHSLIMEDNDFCGYGERKEGDDNA